MAEDESLAAIDADFLKGLELITSAYNRLRARQVGPTWDVPVAVTAIVTYEGGDSHGAT